MLCSFVIPVFKTEAYLPRCLDSLVAQTDGDFEAIVVDDCSPGNCGEIIAGYDKRFKYIRQDRNRSTFQAKATGARAASGDYILPLDSDDFVRPGLIAAIRKAVGADVIAYHMSKEAYGAVWPVKYNHPACECTGEQALEKLFSGRIFMPVCGKAIRREVFLKAYEGLNVGEDFYLNFTDDLCWLLPILFNTKRVTFITYDGYRYWRHADSMTKGVMAPERLSSLAEQSCRSVMAVIAYAERLGLPAATIGKVREQLYPTIRWLLRDMGQSREALEALYGADVVAETVVWDEKGGGFLEKMVRHLVKYGVSATVREVYARLKGLEI